MSMRHLRSGALLFVVVLAACATLRWSGSPPQEGRSPRAALTNLAPEGERPPHASPPAPEVDLILSTDPAKARPRIVVTAPSPARLKSALYPSDLGYETVDVSGYPLRIRADYRVYERVCSRCHTLARSNFAPYVGRAWWRFYLIGMRARSTWKGAPLSREETRAILDFLDYDSQARKLDRRQEFEQISSELEHYFDVEIGSRMERLQKNRSVLKGL